MSTEKVALVLLDVALDLWADPGQQTRTPLGTSRKEAENGGGGGRVTILEHWDIVQRHMYYSERNKGQECSTG